ncbi:MAG: NUDIX hydrolase [Flaviflexus sp.]|nr:NUDIX hydrolase [Flaviflexus sp.]
MIAEVMAAGALVWRQRSGKIEVLLVHRPTYGDWTIPKGKADPGESLDMCAIREVEEETGVPIRLCAPLGRVDYRLSSGRSKHTAYWLARPLGKGCDARRARDKVSPAKKKEIDDTAWFSLDKAHRVATYDSDRELLGRLADLLEDGKADTRTLIIARHERAKKRSAWKGGEEDRPLTKGGAKRAERLADALTARGITRLISSPWKRCRDSFVPYADATNLTIETAGELTEEAHSNKPGATAALIENVLADLAEPTAVCVHRPTLPTIIEVMEKSSQHRAARQFPDTDPWLKPGEIIVAHVVSRAGNPRIVAAERLRP